MWNAERQGRALLSSIQAQRYWLSQVRPQTGGRRPRAHAARAPAPSPGRARPRLRRRAACRARRSTAWRRTSQTEPSPASPRGAARAPLCAARRVRLVRGEGRGVSD
jgi:hypothetical protein